MSDDILITTLAQRPEYVTRIYEMDDPWPEFMAKDPAANALFHRVGAEFPEYCLIATLPDGTPVARGRSVPFAYGVEGRETLPEGGWDRVMVWASNDRYSGRDTNLASALEIAIAPAYLGKGLSYRMLAALRDAVRAAGHDTLVAPVRPNGKDRDHLRTPMTEYARLTRADGLPVDPWLRVHVRAGGRIVKVAPTSMVVPGSLAQWRSWTGLPFAEAGEVEVPGALVPVLCQPAHDYAVYVEPNVWVEHDLR
jgi:GNAT superfamily N-acetyltransferase